MGDNGQIDQICTLFAYQNHLLIGTVGGFVRKGDRMTTRDTDIDHFESR